MITPSDAFVTLSSTDALNRFSLGAVVGGIQTYTVTFDGAVLSNWTTPVLITVTAVNDYNRTDPHYTTLTITADKTVVRPRHARTTTVSQSFDVLTLDDNTPGVYVAQSGGSTLVSAGSSGDDRHVHGAAARAAGDRDDRHRRPDRRRPDLDRHRRGLLDHDARPRLPGSRSATRRRRRSSPAT